MSQQRSQALRDPGTVSLFAESDEERTRSALLEAFDGYVAARAAAPRAPGRAGRPWRAESEAVHREMWRAFVEYCAPRLISLESLTPGEIESYLATRGGSRDLSARYAWRLITLIDKVSHSVAASTQRAPNPAARLLLATPAFRDANTPEFEPALEYLTALEARKLIAFLTDNGSAAQRPALKKAWTDVRDRTAVALQLGAGLTPGECRVLQVADVVVGQSEVRDRPWKLTVPANGNYPRRETPIAGWASRQLGYWIEVRTKQGIAGDMLFPASAAGKPWGRSAVYESGRAVLEAAGLAAPAGGTYRLRHTFALRQLAQGKSESDVAAWLGLKDLSTIERYRRVVMRPVTDLV